MDKGRHGGRVEEMGEKEGRRAGVKEGGVCKRGKGGRMKGSHERGGRGGSEE